MSNQKSIDVNVTDPGGNVIGKVSTTGTTTLPPSASTPLTAVKTSSGKVTRVTGVLPNTSVVFDLPDSGK